MITTVCDIRQERKPQWSEFNLRKAALKLP